MDDAWVVMAKLDPRHIGAVDAREIRQLSCVIPFLLRTSRTRAPKRLRTVERAVATPA
jgi:hypothetical protein